MDPSAHRLSDRADLDLAADAKRILDTYLRKISFRSEVYYRGQLCDTWYLDTSGSNHVNFHVVCHGACWLRMPGLREPQALREGDVVVVPRDVAHLLTSGADSPAEYGKIFKSRQTPLDRQAPGTALVCGYLVVDANARELVFATLPEYLIVRSTQDPAAKPIRGLIELLFAEAQNDGVGAVAVLDRLADALMFYILRHVFEHGTQPVGLLAALADKPIRAALVAIGDKPVQPWTVEAMAQVACMSRSAFTERFSALLGKAPMEFLTQWRMQLARGWLERERSSVADVAARCGYQSEAAFSKAFKRVIGVGPGEFRRIHSR